MAISIVYFHKHWTCMCGILRCSEGYFGGSCPTCWLFVIILRDLKLFWYTKEASYFCRSTKPLSTFQCLLSWVPKKHTPLTPPHQPTLQFNCHILVHFSRNVKFNGGNEIFCFFLFLIHLIPKSKKYMLVNWHVRKMKMEKQLEVIIMIYCVRLLWQRNNDNKKEPQNDCKL